MKILITGSTGLLGQALTRHLARLGEVTGLSRSVPSVPGARRHVTCDLSDARRTINAIASLRPDVVIHAQALSNVDQCERNPEESEVQNVRTTSHVVQALSGATTLLVYLSTDYVFDGTKGAPYHESDRPHPINVYGRSKLEGERIALEHPASIVVRPSTLFGPGRMNFCDHIVTCVTRGQIVEAFTDQVTSPTYTEDLADGIARLLETIGRSSVAALQSRVLHLANDGGCSRIEFAQRIADLLGAPRAQIRGIRMTEQKRPAPRPPYSALTTRHGPQLIGRRLRSWAEALADYLQRRGS